ncbi:germination protein YpeB [Oscillospiraceae bacterium CM]|nr:germination protein YpeB [Oscillospiraceae bacterium CM]
MKRQKLKILIISYTLAGFAALGGLALYNYMTAEGYKLQMENTYQHAFSELASGVGDLDAALQKSLYATTPPMLAAVCTEVYGKAQSVLLALGELPQSSSQLQNMAGFVTKVGDYAFMLAKKAGTGIAGTEEEHGNLVSLSETANVLSGNLNNLMGEINNGNVSLSKINDLTAEAGMMGENAAPDAFQTSLSAIEGEFPETPSLIYDGPFSSHIAGLTPKFLEGKSDVTPEKAQEKAAAFLGIDASALKPNGERAGNLPVYLFYTNMDKGTLSVEVTKKGGIVLDAFNGRIVKKSIIPAKDAVGIAARYLEKKGYKNMKESYYSIDGNTLTVNYAYTAHGVICYPDLIKVSVALDKGSIVGFESQGYVMNHHTRDIPAVKVTEAAAKAKVSPHLSVQTHELAIIPTSGKNEAFCHEFKCVNESGSRYIVYINAITGAEERILILQESDKGTLTM